VVWRDGKTLAWFSIESQSPVVRDLGGRTLDVRAAFPSKEKWLCLVGPHGQWDQGQQLGRGQTLSLFVPEGTRGYLVFDEDHPDAVPLEMPLPATGPLVID
jgi:hypothetical protein